MLNQDPQGITPKLTPAVFLLRWERRNPRHADETDEQYAARSQTDIAKLLEMYDKTSSYLLHAAARAYVSERLLDARSATDPFHSKSYADAVEKMVNTCQSVIEGKHDLLEELVMHSVVLLFHRERISAEMEAKQIKLPFNENTAEKPTA